MLHRYEFYVQFHEANTLINKSKLNHETSIWNSKQKSHSLSGEKAIHWEVGFRRCFERRSSKGLFTNYVTRKIMISDPHPPLRDTFFCTPNTRRITGDRTPSVALRNLWTVPTRQHTQHAVKHKHIYCVEFDCLR